MSAFICSVKTKSVVAALLDKEGYLSPVLFWNKDKIRKVIDTYTGEHITEDTPNRLQIIYNMLDDLNSANVSSRYHTQEHPSYEKVLCVSQKIENLYTIETCKRLSCLIYQCTEDASTLAKYRPVYDLLVTFETALAKYLIAHSKEYAQTEGWE